MKFVQQSLDLSVESIDSNNFKLFAKTPSKKTGKELIEKQLEAYVNTAIESKLKILNKSNGLKLKNLVQILFVNFKGNLKTIIKLRF